MAESAAHGDGAGRSAAADQDQDAAAELQTRENAKRVPRFRLWRYPLRRPAVSYSLRSQRAWRPRNFVSSVFVCDRCDRAALSRKCLLQARSRKKGKSLVSANLAGVLARRKERVLLIEGDMRRPTLADQLGLGRLAGLAEWLQGGLEKPSNIYRLDGPGFWIMPAGDPPANPLELMQSGRLASLMGQLANLFDWIIVDSPPLLPLADTTVWARFTDGTLLVVREGKTEKRPLERGLEIIKKSELLGVVLNGCSNTDHDSYYQRYSPPGTK